MGRCGPLALAAALGSLAAVVAAGAPHGAAAAAPSAAAVPSASAGAGRYQLPACGGEAVRYGAWPMPGTATGTYMPGPPGVRFAGITNCDVPINPAGWFDVQVGPYTAWMVAELPPAGQAAQIFLSPAAGYSPVFYLKPGSYPLTVGLPPEGAAAARASAARDRDVHGRCLLRLHPAGGPRPLRPGGRR